MTVLECVIVYLLVGPPLVLGLLWSGTLGRADGKPTPWHHIALFMIGWPGVFVFMVYRLLCDK